MSPAPQATFRAPIRAPAQTPARQKRFDASGKSSFAALENRGVETIAAVPVRVEAQRRTGVERDLRPRELGARVLLKELRMRGEKSRDDRIVFLGQDAAGRVNDTPAAFDERRRRGKDARLFCRQLGEIVWRLAPLEIGIAAKRPEAGARRVDENAIDLASQALYFGVALVRDQ